MPFDIASYSKLRPFLYHLTHRENLPRLQVSMCLESAARLLKSCGQTEQFRNKREDSVLLNIDRNSVRLTDQARLYAANIEFEAGWDFHRFIAYLNQFVFFWSGNEDGPVAHGQRHFRRYLQELPVMLRVPFASLVSSNRCAPLFCRYNSGSPRCVGGRKSPRGRSTFLEAPACDFARSDVVEVAFKGFVRLPVDIQFRNDRREWVRLERTA
jgi:Family of unknown function (DUF7002)